jgi:tetratricopeptide (TPR) repeat protein
VRSLDGFPLAIELAGILVREGIVSLNDFPTIYKTQHQRLTKFTPGQGQWFLDKDYSLFHMFEMLYRSLSSKNACAALLLTLCSVYGPWAAPMSLFRNLNFFEAPKKLEANIDSCMELRTLAQDETTLRIAVYELYQGVLAIRKQNPTTGEVENISLHGSICRWRIAYLDSESRAEWTMQASYALASHFWDSCKGKDAMHCAKSSQEQSNSSQRVALTESSNFKVARIFTYPAERCIAAIKEHVPAHDLAEDGRYANPYFVTCFYMAHMFLAVGNFEESRGLFAEAKERMHLSSEIEDSIRLLRGFAICCQQTGDLNAAKDALELALRMDSSIEQRMDDDALEIISLLKAVRDRLATDVDHQKRALIASLHPKQQPNRLELQTEHSSHPSFNDASIQSVDDLMTQLHIRQVADINAQDGRYGNALQAQPFFGNEKKVQMLLDQGADVNAQGGIYGNALQAALSEGHEEIVQMLLKIRQLATAAATTSMKVYQLVSTIKNAPREIQNLGRDIKDFYTLVQHLLEALKSADICELIDREKPISRAVADLQYPIGKFELSCRQVESKLGLQLQLDKGEGSGNPDTGNYKKDRVWVRDWMWPIRRKEVYQLISELQQTRLLFSDAMGSLTLYVFEFLRGAKSNRYISMLILRSSATAIKDSAL